MRNPTVAMHGNLRWTRSGVVWADWLLTGAPYGLRPLKAKRAAREMHAALFRGLPGEALLLGISAGLDPGVIVERMMTDIDPDECPGWVQECEATLDWLDSIGPGQRIYWLSVPLTNRSPRDRVQAPLWAALAHGRDLAGLPALLPESEEVERRRQQAARVMEMVPGIFEPRPATPAQMVWLGQHAMHRGLWLDMDLPMESETDLVGVRRTKRGCAIGEPLIDEGGRSDMTRSAQRLDLLNQKFVKVQDLNASGHAAEPSYQVLSVISDVPSGGATFPGGEMLGRIDESGVEVDWAMRMTIRSGREVKMKNQRALTRLTEQMGQREDEQSHSVSMLDRVADSLAEYAAIFDADSKEAEVEPTIIFAVGGVSAEAARIQNRELGEWIEGCGYVMSTPLGHQKELWWAMQPGVATSSGVRAWSQLTTASDLSVLIPIASAGLGDRKGSCLGLNLANGALLDEDLPCGPTQVVLHDLEGASDRQISGSAAVAGELGSGKTATLAKLATDVVTRRGQLVIADRTAKGEWASWAEALMDTVVVNTADPTVSLDPLRVFGPDVGARMLSSFISPLLALEPASKEGALLASVLEGGYLSDHGLDSAGAVLAHLESGCAVRNSRELAEDLAARINVFARRGEFGRVIFDGSIPPLDTSVGAIVVRTHTLLLPSREELEHEHLFRQMGVEKVFGRALNALIASMARQICFADTSRLAGFVVSEAHSMTISHEGERELVDFVRDGRKHRAVVLLDSHDPEADFGSPTLRGLIPTRILMRHRDETLAKRGLHWLDLDDNDDELVSLIMRDTSPLDAHTGEVLPWRRGEALMRDMSANVGRMKVMLPRRPEMEAAITRGGTAAARTRKGEAVA